MPARAQAWMTHADDVPPRTERPASTAWLLLPSDVLTVARCASHPLPIGRSPAAPTRHDCMTALPLLCRLGQYAIRALSCTCRPLYKSINIEERRVATLPLMQLVVYDGSIGTDETTTARPFSCQHRPCCANEQTHAQLTRENAEGRREKWRAKQPRATPPALPAPRPPQSSDVGRGTRMPAVRQVCSVHPHPYPRMLACSAFASVRWDHTKRLIPSRDA